MENKNDKKKITLEISRPLYKEVHQAILDKFGTVFGHIGEAFKEGIKLWLKKQSRNGKENEDETEKKPVSSYYGIQYNRDVGAGDVGRIPFSIKKKAHKKKRKIKEMSQDSK